MTDFANRHLGDGPISYAEAKWIYDHASKKPRFKPDNGAAVRGSANTRLKRKANGCFVVSIKPRGRIAADLFQISPGDVYTILAETYSGYIYGGIGLLLMKRLGALTPVSDDASYYPSLVNPDRGSKPTPKPHADVPRPRWVPAEERSLVPSYEANIARFGSLEAWHEAWHQAEIIRRENESALYEWASKKRVSIFMGAVFDADGVVSKRSLQKYEARLRAERVKQLRKNAKAQKAGERAERARQAQRNRDAKVALAWVSKFTSASVSPDAARWLQSNKIEPNPDGTVPLYKWVNKDLTSHYGTLGRSGVEYEVGTIVTASDYDSHEGCGGGLHFSTSLGAATKHLWRGAGGASDVGLLCHVDLETLVVISHGKVKAKWCKVIEAISGETAISGEAVAGPVTITTAQQVADKMAKAARKAVEGDSGGS